MTPEQLKASILQYAIQGKLVKQRPEEGTGEELYRQIQDEKKRLIREGKIKKEKPLPEITEEEIPFDIPESWKWVRFGEAYSLSNGTASRGTKGGTMRPVLRLADLSGGAVSVSNIRYIELSEKEFLAHRVVKDDLIFIRVNGTKARVATAFHYEEDKAISYCDHLFCGHKVSGNIFAKYMMCVFNATSTRKQLLPQIKTTAGQNTISQASMAQILIPFPPLAEQKRIVAKIEELLPYIDRYAAAYEKLEQFNAKFPEDMKKSVLQYAIQGKLVEQRPEEGTGEELYQQIQEEKQRLIKAGKIKQEKPLPEITEGEIPFDIPESWKWVRLADISKEKPTNGFSPKGVEYQTPTRVLTLTATTSGYFKPGAFKYSDVQIESNSKYWLKTGDILIQRSNSRDLVGISCIYLGEDNGYIYPDLMMRIRALSSVAVEYVDYVLKAPETRNYFSRNASGTSESMPKINQGIVSQTLIPLPPLAEQKRIVAKLKEILTLCER